MLVENFDHTDHFRIATYKYQAMSMNNDKVRLITSKQYIYLVETAVSFK
jgi:hypothetical protein